MSPTPNRLENRKLILCEQTPPDNCVHCEKPLPDPEQQSLMMINAEGEAVICTGPVRLCDHCSSVYAFEGYYAEIASRFEFDPFAMVGFIDYELLPPEQRDLIGEDEDIPMPLLEFTGMQALQKARFD